MLEIGEFTNIIYYANLRSLSDELVRIINIFFWISKFKYLTNDCKLSNKIIDLVKYYSRQVLQTLPS